ncbi:hypothetical protein QBC32DRAFT_111656 [Pseudoneurospora amorphoporcata]|uniref:Exonuclease domain-containing protein n=1 Tax=Pseudoneurospora amorphoporcata TaxID=241081 RepID=A0AAN6NZC0_9PEZI|nr:hypothetical protein QBC32DRAFT_111656 [Pseudoneurospora amorphoporcata]
MDTVLQNLGSIPCPHGDRCTESNCLFQHSWNKKPAVPASAKHDGLIEDDNPRKRRKLSSEPTQSTVSTTAESSKPNLEPVTAKKPVSPPPLGRKPTVLSVQSAPLAAPATPASKPAATSSQTILKSEKSSEKMVPIRRVQVSRKIETLNPRMLKGVAPATFEFRFRALTMLHEQLARLNKDMEKAAGKDEESKKLVLTPQELIWLSLDLEEKIAMDKPAIYNNVIKNRITGYKKMTPKQWKEERLAEIKEEQRKAAATQAGSKKQALLGPPKVIKTGLTPQEEIAFLPHLLTSITELAQHGYVPKPPSEEEVKKAREGIEAAMGWEVCDRCTKRFQVFPGRREEDGALTTGGPCTYHWGRLLYPERNPTSTAQQEMTYKCCKQLAGDSTGCTSCSTHVFTIKSPARLATIVPFMETPENPSVPKDRAVCFDCEMCYTVNGLELVRLTAVNWPDGKELLDILVRPMGEILDLNSRFSGVWPEDLINAEPWKPVAPLDPAVDPVTDNGPTTKSPQSNQGRKKMQRVDSLSVARDLLFSLISPTTPLIGHGLENDLNAMRICHPTLIDTVLLFPHKKLLPYRYGLKVLMEWKLNKAIQVEPDADAAADGKLLGHDSAEDARAAGELVRYMIQEKWADMKRKGWTLKEGGFVPPKDKKEIRGEKWKKWTVEGIEGSAAAGSTGAMLAEVKRRTRDGTEDGEVVEV